MSFATKSSEKLNHTQSDNPSSYTPPKKVMVPSERGVKLIHNPAYNKGTAFTEKEREILGLKGLLPPRVIDQDLQADRIMENLHQKSDELEKYVYMVGLQDRNENLFYYVIQRHLEELMPIIYTPTVGKACQLFGHIYRRSRGLYISHTDKGHVKEILLNWPHKDVKVIVVTDGGRILGLGDLGVNGMGIPIGKLALYTACAGIDPTSCLPVTVDVGTNNSTLIEDPLYLGDQRSRITGEDYLQLFDEFVEAVEEVFPNAIIQFEDFATANAFELLQRYRSRTRVFNDDIQGTASVALAGLISALRITGQKLEDQKILFLGAGEAGIGIGDMISLAMEEEGMSGEEAKRHCWFVDSKGLVCNERTDLSDHKLAYAHDHQFISKLEDLIEVLKPTTLIGVSGQGGAFTKKVIRLMAEINENPIIFALSNPTSKSECTAEQAYEWSNGRAIFASGSPFEPVQFKGRSLVPGQGNNVYIFPGVGLGLSFCHARKVTDRMFYRAAKELAASVSEEELDKGTVYPSFTRIREVSLNIAVAVVKEGIASGLVSGHYLTHLKEKIKQTMYSPEYPEYF